MDRRRTTLRAWMAVIAAFGLLFAWVRWEGSWGYALVVASHSKIAWVLSFLAAFAFARWLGVAVRSSRVRTLVSVLRAVVLAAALYAAWSHVRANYFIFLQDWGFPYPDRAIIRLERWFDARRPVPPGTIKMHGEFPIVTFIFGAMVLVLSGGAGFLSGLLANRPDGPSAQPVGPLIGADPAHRPRSSPTDRSPGA
jgi:hypothetical protein